MKKKKTNKELDALRPGEGMREKRDEIRKEERECATYSLRAPAALSRPHARAATHTLARFSDLQLYDVSGNPIYLDDVSMTLGVTSRSGNLGVTHFT